MLKLFSRQKDINAINKNNTNYSLYVQDVIDFSSQYGKELSKSYTVANIRSFPTHYPRYGDFLESCVFRTYGTYTYKKFK